METPASVDLSKLKNILGNARAVMQKTEQLKPQSLSENTQKQSQFEEQGAYVEQPVGYTAEMVKNSKLPDAIKNLMIARPIVQPTMMGNSFSAADMYNENDEKPMPDTFQKKQTKARPINEAVNRGSDMISMSRAELDSIINERLLEFMTKTYNKTVTENAISSTIKKLISEGIIPKRKI